MTSLESEEELKREFRARVYQLSILHLKTVGELKIFDARLGCLYISWRIGREIEVALFNAAHTKWQLVCAIQYDQALSDFWNMDAVLPSLQIIRRHMVLDDVAGL